MNYLTLYYNSSTFGAKCMLNALMMVFINPSQALTEISSQLKARRLAMDLTQDGLALRSGVPLATLRKFEQKGLMSLQSLVRLLWIVGGLEEMVNALKPVKPDFKSIDEVLEKPVEKAKRGRRK